MEKMINELLEAAKISRKGFFQLKSAAMTLGNNELIQKLCEIQAKYHTETIEQKLAKERGKELTALFKKVGLEVPMRAAWIIEQTLKVEQEKKNDFSIVDANEIILKDEEIFYTPLY